MRRPSRRTACCGKRSGIVQVPPKAIQIPRAKLPQPASRLRYTLAMADRVWEELSRTLRSSAPYKSLLQGLGDVVRLPVPAAAWIGELLANDLGRSLLVVVPREADALGWIEAARLFGR